MRIGEKIIIVIKIMIILIITKVNSRLNDVTSAHVQRGHVCISISARIGYNLDISARIFY